jgi:hypothetical protein
MEMPDQMQAHLKDTYSEVLRQAKDMQWGLQQTLTEVSLDKYPRNGAYLMSLAQGLGEVAAMAEMAVERSSDREPGHA